MKKILIISNMYPSKKYKHYGIFVENTAQILKNNGYHVTVSALRKKDNKIGKLIGYGWFYLKAIVLSMFQNYDYLYAHYVSHCALLIKIIKKIKPNIKLIINVHGNDVVPENDHDKQFIPIVKEIMPMVDVCITPSVYFQNVMIHDYHLPKYRVKVFPSGGINQKIFKHYENTKEEYQLDTNKQTIGYVGRYEIRKGWEIFLEAIHMLDDLDNYQIIMVGTGNEEDQVNQLIKKYHLDVKKYPMQNQKELAKIYSAIDIFCFPTYRKSESLGLVGLEAMACGAITITSNMAGPTSYIKDGINGFFFEAKNTNDLKEKISYVSTMPKKEKEKIKKEALETVREYSVENISNILLDIFDHIE
ncbi:MAG: glycosyltransferase family 4 protein [Faecalibacillus sp.]